MTEFPPPPLAVEAGTKGQEDRDPGGAHLAAGRAANTYLVARDGGGRWGDGARRIAGLVLLRALVTSALFGAALATSGAVGEENAARGVLYAFLLTAYASSALELIWILTGRGLGALAWVHAAIETTLAGWLVALTGGPAGPFSFLFLLSTVHGAIAAGSSGAFGAASLATILLGILGAHPVLPFWTAPLAGAGDTSQVAAAIFANSGGCFATAALASYLTERLLRTGQALTARELELRSLGELYMSVVQSLGSGLLTLDSTSGDARVSLLNEAGGEILGVESASAARGRTLADLAPDLAHALELPQLGGRAECSIERKGHRRLIGFSVSPLLGSEGAPMGSVVAFQDVTELRRLEASLRRQSHLASLGELSAGLAHEIRNPLAALSGAVQMLATSPASADDARLLDLIRREATHLGRLVSDFLTFARPPPPSLHQGDLAELVSECCQAFENEVATQGKELSRVLQPATARFDPDQMRQVVSNLVRNALEATDVGGRVQVSVQAIGPSCVLAIEDDGPGVSAEA
ncbi:MAG TPA: histidine kinase dimerization/phospho-acceptor domain-containing protein, partial [Myxococcales bacterium]|nr:histidine kinase dimerization/phospho-acceptor domain-containing protein [Myxococcales bacterium]